MGKDLQNSLVLSAAAGLAMGLMGCGEKMPADPSDAVGDDAADAAASATGDKDCCKGQNKCEAKGNCETADNKCRGLNKCEGKGGCKPKDCG